MAMRATIKLLCLAVALACWKSCECQSYEGYAPTTASYSPGSARRLQGSFSPFDSAYKTYGYGPKLNGRHLLETKRRFPAAATGRSLMQAYSPLAYAADSLGLDYTEGSARKRALLEADSYISAPQAYAARPGSYGGYGYAPHPRLLQEIPAGAIGDAAVSYPAYAAYAGPAAYKPRPIAYGGF